MDTVSAIAAVPGTDSEIRSRIRQLVAAELRPLVRRIDEEAYYPVEFLGKLGAAGAYCQHLSHASGTSNINFYNAIIAMATVAEDCLATAFCMWCQNALGWYLENTANEALGVSVRAKVGDGSILGGTGLSNPMKALSGFEPLRLKGRRVQGGWIVNGVLPWVSNLGEGHLFGICFAREEAQAQMVMALARIGDPGVAAHGGTHFIALEGTATMRVAFKDAFVADHFVLADPGEPLIRRIRPGFLLLQTGMALGLIRGCLNGLATLPKRATDFLPEPPSAIENRLQALDARIRRLARTPTELDRDCLTEILEARLEASSLALSAAQCGMLSAGAGSYIQGSAYNRRLREAYFIALVTPSMRHVRRDLEALRAQRVSVAGRVCRRLRKSFARTGATPLVQEGPAR